MSLEVQRKPHFFVSLNLTEGARLALLPLKTFAALNNLVLVDFGSLVESFVVCSTLWVDSEPTDTFCFFEGLSLSLVLRATFCSFCCF